MRMALAEQDRRPQPHLVFSNVRAGYGGLPVLNGVSGALGLSEIVSVLGPNGAGKSTLLKAILGLLTLSSGAIQLGSQTVTGATPEELARKRLAYVPQHKDVFDPLTVTENLEMGGYLFPIEVVRARMAEILKQFPALADMRGRRAGKLSGGERKMLAVAKALMMSPNVLLLDEPTAGLAPDVAEAFLKDHLPRLASSGIGILLVEQKIDAALSVSDWVYVLAAGTKRMEGPPETLVADSDLGAVLLGQTRSPSGRPAEGSHS